MTELKIVKTRNVFKPRWWQIRFRYRLWKSQRKYDKAKAKLSPEQRRLVDEADKEFEKEILFGKDWL